MRLGPRIIPEEMLTGALGQGIRLLLAAANGGAATTTYGHALSLSMVFVAFFVMLGPLKLIGPFARQTSGIDQAAARTIAFRAFGIACTAGLFAAAFGRPLLSSWRISLPALHLAAGAVLFLVALRTLLIQYQPEEEPSVPSGPARAATVARLAFPTILTPYGIATFILLLAVAEDAKRELLIVALFFAVMVLDLGAMWFARAIVHRIGPVLAIAGSILGVLQVALAVQMILNAFRALQILPST